MGLFEFSLIEMVVFFMSLRCILSKLKFEDIYFGNIVIVYMVELIY